MSTLKVVKAMFKTDFHRKMDRK